jgi:hypothetical protein
MFYLLAAIRGGDNGIGIKKIVTTIKKIHPKKGINVAKFKTRLEDLIGCEIEDYDIAGEDDDDDDGDAKSVASGIDDDDKEKQNDDTMKMILESMNSLAKEAMEAEGGKVENDNKGNFYCKKTGIYSFDKSFMQWFIDVISPKHSFSYGEFEIMDMICDEVLFENMKRIYNMKTPEEILATDKLLKKEFPDLQFKEMNYLDELEKDCHQFRLTRKKGKHFQAKINAYLDEQKKEMAANISFNVYNASLILCMAACDYGNINKLYYKANKAHEEKLLEDTAFSPLNKGWTFNIEERFGLDFLMKFGIGDQEGWDIKGTDGVVSSKIHPDTMLVKTLGALCRNDKKNIYDLCIDLCNKLSIDYDLMTSIISIAMGDERYMHKAIDILATRLRCDSQLCLGFVCGASLNFEFVEECLTALCENLGLSANLAAAIVMIAQTQGGAHGISMDAFEHLLDSLQSKSDSDNDEVIRKKGMKLLGIITGDIQKIADPDDFKEMQKKKAKTNSPIIKYPGRIMDELLGFKDIKEKMFEKGIWKKVSLCSILILIAKDDKSEGLKYICEAFNINEEDQKLLDNVIEIYNRTATDEQVEMLNEKIIDESNGKKKNKNLLCLFYALLRDSVTKFAELSEAGSEEDTSELLGSIHSRKFEIDKDNHKLFAKIIGSDDEDTGEFIYASLVANLKTIIEKVEKVRGIEKDTVEELSYLACNDNEALDSCEKKYKNYISMLDEGKQQNEGKLMSKMAEKLLNSNDNSILKKYENDRPMAIEILTNLLLVIAHGRGGLGGERQGAVSHEFEKLAKDLGLDQSDIEMLNALYLASVDAPTFMDKIVKAIPVFTSKLLSSDGDDDNNVDKINKLITGIVRLCAPLDTKERQDKARKESFEELSKALDVDNNEVESICMLAQSEMKGFRHIAQELGEYDHKLMVCLHSLTLRLAPIIWRDSTGESDQEGHKDKKKSSSASKKESGGETDDGKGNQQSHENNDDQGDDGDNKKNAYNREEQIDYVFSTFDRNSSGYITIDEFIEVMKSYQITMTEHKALELFIIEDQNCTGVISVDGFRKILKVWEAKMMSEIINKKGKGIAALATKFLAICVVLVFLLSFILLGISGFGSGGGFSAVINSMLPMFMGGGVSGSDGGDDGDEDGDEDADNEEVENEVNLNDAG